MLLTSANLPSFSHSWT